MKDPGRIARAEASAWIVRLHGPHRTPALELGFRAWLAASAENARQFERVTATWEAGATPVAGLPRVVQAESPRQSRLWLLAAALALFVVSIGTWHVTRFWPDPSYTTGVGERRIVTLPDGSRVTLNSGSGVMISYGRRERRIRIDHGEAFFEVAKDPVRPFRVLAGEQQIAALGTSFIVRRESNVVTVTLVEGVVSVFGPGHFAPSALAAGERLRVSEAGVEIDEPSVEAATAWLRGEVMLDGTPLADAIAEMNRYDARRLVLDDPTIADVRISGIYHAGDSELFAKMVAQLYGFDVRRRQGRIYMRAGAKTVDGDR